MKDPRFDNDRKQAILFSPFHNLLADLEGNFVSDGVLSRGDLLHLLLDVFLGGSLHVDVIAIAAGVVAGDGLETREYSALSFGKWRTAVETGGLSAKPCENPASGSCPTRVSAADGRRRCRPSPSRGAPEGAAGRSRARRDTFCSRRPADDSG